MALYDCTYEYMQWIVKLLRSG